MITIRNAFVEDIPLIRQLAYKIWPTTYAHILTVEQQEYMLNMMYGKISLQKQITEERHRFIIGYENEEAVAFASYSVVNENEPVCRLHKIYILQNQQGKGSGKKIVDYIIEDCKLTGIKFLELNVNRFNKARSFYEKLGFRIIREENNAIGKGFVMNDYVMQKPV